MYLHVVLCRTQGPQLPVTYEQARIVIQEVKSEELMKIVAFAGIVLSQKSSDC